MNDEILQELERRYNAFLDQKEIDGDACQTGAISYFRFIEETPILRNIATSVFSVPLSPSVTWHEANDLFQTYILHKPISFERGNSVRSMITSSGIRHFHRYMVDGVKQFGLSNGLSNKQKILLHKESGNNRICSVGKTLHCYSIKGEAPKRFDIVLELFKGGVGRSAREIAAFLHKDEEDKTVQDNIKKEIRKINALFKVYCDVSDDLILHERSKGKNIYFLNREQFSFEVER